MATSVPEQIALKVKTRLGLISTGSGYETTTTGVVRPTRIATFQPKDYQIVVTQGDLEPNPDLSHPGNPPAKAWDLPFLIAGILRTSELDTTASDSLKNQFGADVVKALGVPTSGDWAQWDGLAINSDVSGVEDYQSSDGAESGFKVTLVVTLRTDETNLYNVRA